MTRAPGRPAGVRIGSGARAAAAFVALLATGGATASAQGLTNAPALSRAYDAIFDARFDRVPTLLDEACGPRWKTAPRPDSATLAAPEACGVLEAVSLWWQIQLDPLDRAHDREFERRADAAVAAADAWTDREPDRAEAWFYLGAAHGVRVQWRALRGERLAAARDGKRIKDALERAVSIDPDLQDAYFGIGLYHYYADVAPAAARLLRWLLLLPGGDKATGLREMLRARNGGQVIRSEADYQLHVLYLWYEKQPERALALARALQDRHPRNPLFQQIAADIEETHLSNYAASRRSWRALLDDAVAGRVEAPRLAEARARLGLARQLDRLSETDAAIEQLRTLLGRTPAPGAPAPVGVEAQAYAQLGQALDRMGNRDEALAAYRASIAATPEGDPLKTAAGARAGLQRAPDADGAQAYRLSLEGWRALERGDVTAASRALERSLALRPDDEVTRYRRARLLVAQRNDRAAIDLLEAVVSAPGTPPHVYAAACLDAAQAHERQGDVMRAMELYTLTLDAFGVEPAARAAAARALARLSKRAGSRVPAPPMRASIEAALQNFGARAET